MVTKDKSKSGLDKKFQKVQETPASFEFFMAIHDFIEYIEGNQAFKKILSAKNAINSELKISTKYDYLKLIYQGLQDSKTKSDADLGHSRYAVILELNKIKDNDVSNSNSFWKKRDVIRKFATDIYSRLVPATV